MTPRQTVIGADILAGLILVSVAAALGGLAWHVMMPVDAPRATVTRRPAVTPAIDIQPIIALAPFGAATPITADGGEAALTLRGIVMARQPALSSALIAGPGTTVAAYRIGARLPNGAVIAAIARDTVTLDLSGKQVRLAFPRRARSDIAIADGPAADSSTDTIVIAEPDSHPASNSVANVEVVPAPTASTSAGAPAPPRGGAEAIRALIPPSVAGVPATPPANAPRQP